MEKFTGVLNTNENYDVLRNMIISIDVYSPNLRADHTKLVDSARVDGTLYGDTKVYTYGDTKYVNDWLGDAEGARLLETDRNKKLTQVTITLDVFKIITNTTDEYLSKRAWMGEGQFAQFIGLQNSLVIDTKKNYDATTYNTYIGTHQSSAAVNTLEIVTPVGATKEETNRLEAQTIAMELANLFTDGLQDATRDYNEFGYLMSFNPSDFKFVWNAKFVSKITKLDLPTIFHLDGLKDSIGEYTLPSRFFGEIIGKTVTTATGVERAMQPMILNDPTGGTKTEYFAGDLIKVGTDLTQVPDYEGCFYIPDDTIALKIVHKDNVPFMSGFKVNTEFFNPRGLYSNKYMIFGHNTLDTIGLPYITVKVTKESE